MTYLAQFEAYLITHKRVSTNTLQAYRCDIRQLQAFAQEKNLALEQVNAEVLKQYLTYLHQNCGLNARSISRKIAACKAFFEYLATHHQVPNPTQDLYTPKIKKTLPVFLTQDEVKELLKVANSATSPVTLRNKIMLYLLYASGVRISELVGMRLSEIHGDTGFITVRGKGSKERMIPLPAPMMLDLIQYINEIRPRLFADEVAAATHDILFPTKYGGKVKCMTRQSFWIIIQNLWKKTEIKKRLSPHKLRHSLATHLLNNGADLRSLQLLLGHERIATVEIYTHVETKRLREEYDKRHPRS
jgi:integrase/recombinase XerD